MRAVEIRDVSQVAEARRAAVALAEAHGFDFEVERAVTCDLVEHVVEERHARVELLLAGTVKVDGDADLRLVGVALDFGGAGHGNVRDFKCCC